MQDRTPRNLRWLSLASHSRCSDCCHSHHSQTYRMASNYHQSIVHLHDRWCIQSRTHHSWRYHSLCRPRIHWRLRCHNPRSQCYNRSACICRRRNSQCHRLSHRLAHSRRNWPLCKYWSRNHWLGRHRNLTIQHHTSVHTYQQSRWSYHARWYNHYHTHHSSTCPY